MGASIPTNVVRICIGAVKFSSLYRAGGVEPLPYAGLTVGCKRRTSQNVRPFSSSVSLREPPVPTPFVPAGHFPLIGGICPSRGRLWVMQCTTVPRPREIPRRGRNPFLVGQRIAKGRSKLPLAVFLYTASGTFFPHGKKGGLSSRRSTAPRKNVQTGGASPAPTLRRILYFFLTG